MKSTSKLDYGKIEKKWQKKWMESDIYATPKTPDTKSNKKYVLDMFPYPSGATMHVGHLEGYVGTDVYSRYLRMKGYSVLHPMGWDAFGLPAENYAIKTGINPNDSTHKNIETFKRQLLDVGLSYDWSKEIDTSDPKYYKWTQWMFIQLFKKGLAYKKMAPVNWCPKDETVLANEQVVNGKCERCDTEVIKKDLEQWFFKITNYADKLISGLERLDWLEEVKTQQINWIGRSEGMLITFETTDGGSIEVFTTRPDTLNAATFIAVSDDELYNKYRESKEKFGEFMDRFAINPLTGSKIPIWKTNYVASGYGTGAIMGVPAHDERDMDFAKKYDLDIVDVSPDKKLWKLIPEKGWGKPHKNYHLRDWLISRQRYWGTPIPMIHCKDCDWQPVPEADLPVLLPNDVDFLPHGESPIARSKSFQKDVKCPKCGGEAKRETDTMDGFGDNSWYFIRFTDPDNDRRFASNAAIKTWLPVDTYVGGGHVVQHLLYSRFFWKFLFDEGLIDKSCGDEPFLKLRAPGWILGPDSRKMSKRWGNVITPDDIIPKFGADTLRMYEMFMGPFDIVKPWSITGVEGTYRFLNRVWSLFKEEKMPDKASLGEVQVKMHQTIKKVTNDIEILHFNTAISSLMEYVNTLKEHGASKENLKVLAQLIAPFAPHLAEEVWVEVLKEEFSVHRSSWPTFDPQVLVSKQIDIIVQVNGKVRGQISVDSSEIEKEQIEELAKNDDKVAKWLASGKIKKVIYVPSKIINFVIANG